MTTDHVPGGGTKKIFNDPLALDHVGSRIGSLENIDHQPGGGEKKILDDPLKLHHVRSRIGSLENIGKYGATSSFLLVGHFLANS